MASSMDWKIEIFRLLLCAQMATDCSDFLKQEEESKKKKDCVGERELCKPEEIREEKNKCNKWERASKIML